MEHTVTCTMVILDGIWSFNSKPEKHNTITVSVASVHSDCLALSGNQIKRHMKEAKSNGKRLNSQIITTVSYI